MKKQLIGLWLVLCTGAALADVPVDALTQEAYEAGKDAIAARYAADRKQCDRVKGQARAVCRAQASGREKVELAKLEARHAPGPEATQDAKVAIAEAKYGVARARCKALDGDAEDMCVKEAKATLEAAVRQARVEKVDSTGGMFGSRARARRS